MSSYNPYFYQENLKESYKTSSTLRDGYGAQDLRHCPKGHSFVWEERGEGEREEGRKGSRVLRPLGLAKKMGISNS